MVRRHTGLVPRLHSTHARSPTSSTEVRAEGARRCGKPTPRWCWVGTAVELQACLLQMLKDRIIQSEVRMRLCQPYRNALFS